MHFKISVNYVWESGRLIMERMSVNTSFQTILKAYFYVFKNVLLTLSKWYQASRRHTS